MLLDPRLLVVLAQLFLFADKNDLDVTITSIYSGREHIETISRTHEEHRAIDVRSKNWPEEKKEELVAFLEETVGHHGAVGFLTGETRVIIYEKDAVGGEHFHLQVSRLVKNYVYKKKTKWDHLDLEDLQVKGVTDGRQQNGNE